MRLGLVCGLAREARFFHEFDPGPSHTAEVSVGYGRAAGDAATALIAAGAEALLSVGYAGGLAPSVGAGQLILAEAIIGRPRSGTSGLPSNRLDR